VEEINISEKIDTIGRLTKAQQTKYKE